VPVATLSDKAMAGFRSQLSVAVAPLTSWAVRWAVTAGLPVDVDLRGSGAESRG